ncbi:DUF2953 domain-containing protein [Ruminiclostridium cellulolyticum]|uniref:DUF2953 domain-containing protein n=1 Tax=Ruminiclostridium cellulolyticum (strain ATCC 35319 / DSM 5812 / JCM 6584 / H10) TaxID=394503 RepID=B8I5U5_RUMCH|nr:DUF2953 domain-containing protein [Ruminiclostridium cellulolyticum]ACL74762.1 conserved hypothetical protein [Ruminiclostridium cellulolyticum H10]
MVALIITLKIISYVFLIIAALILLIIFVPFKYYAEGAKNETIVVKGYANWLFGAVTIRFNYNTQDGFDTKFNLFGIKKGFKKKNESEPLKQVRESKLKKTKDKPAYSYFTYEVFMRGLKSVFKILNHFKPSIFRIDAEVGFEDPMYTGLLCAIRNTWFASFNKDSIRIETNFEEETLEGSFLIGGGIQIFYLILVGIEFVFSKPFKSILFKNMKYKIKRRLKKWRKVSIFVKT